MAKKKLSIEETFEQIEEIISQLEQEETKLDDAMKLYKDGVKMLKTCQNSLDDVEKQIMLIEEEDEDGTSTTC